MNKRQKKKAWNKFVRNEGRSGCEYCRGISNPIWSTDEGWINASLQLSRESNKDWRFYLKENNFDTGESEKISYIKEVNYCYRCGRKLK